MIGKTFCVVSQSWSLILTPSLPLKCNNPRSADYWPGSENFSLNLFVLETAIVSVIVLFSIRGEISCISDQRYP